MNGDSQIIVQSLSDGRPARRWSYQRRAWATRRAHKLGVCLIREDGDWRIFDNGTKPYLGLLGLEFWIQELEDAIKTD